MPAIRRNGRRIHDGALGKIVCGEAYYLTGYEVAAGKAPSAALIIYQPVD